MYKPAIVTGLLFGALAVMLGAFGAHGLKDLVDADQIKIFEKGVSYEFYHSFALLITGILHTQYPSKALRTAMWFFSFGILFFSGSLYLMVGLSSAGLSIGPAGIITPIGGLCFIVGWISVLIGVLKKQ
jgi:uncharacterized membrane protein YgdD (TMEM256/DUF423 family)